MFAIAKRAMRPLAIVVLTVLLGQNLRFQQVGERLPLY